MAKPRKSWEPEHRFGGNPASFYKPAHLGEDQWKATMKKPTTSNSSTHAVARRVNSTESAIMRELKIEDVWMTKAGLVAIVIMTDMGHRCGYVGVLPGHALHGVGYSENTFALLPPKADTPVGKRGVFTLLSGTVNGVIARSPEMVFDVHGGLNFAGSTLIKQVDQHLGQYGVWWFGYDCAHCDDAPSPEHIAKQKELYPDKPFMWCTHGGIHRTHEYCVAECESLAAQIQKQTASKWVAWLRKVFHSIRTYRS